MSVRFRLISAALVMAALAATVQAQTPQEGAPLSADPSNQIDTYVQNLGHDKARKKSLPATSHAIVTQGITAGVTGGVMPAKDVAAVAAPAQPPLVLAAVTDSQPARTLPQTEQGAGPLSPDQSKQLDAYLQNMGHDRAAKKSQSATRHAIVTPGMMPGSDVATVTAPDQRTLENLLALSAPDSEPVSMTFGMASGFGVRPDLPELAAWDRQAGQAIVAAFANPDKDATADQVATFAAVPAGDAEFEERVGLARTLFRVDGTEDMVRHFVSREHMKLIIQEIARHIDFAKLSETDRVRLATIAAVAQTELEDKILDLNARNQAKILTAPELMQLIVAFDIDPQRKLTNLRLNDDGKLDRAAELDLRLAQYTIVKQFETGQ